MIMGDIGILKQKAMFRIYYRKEKTGAWKLIRLEGEIETPWSDRSFKEIFRNLQVDASTSALGFLVISDKEESIDFPQVKEVLPFSYEELRDFCRKYSPSAAHWIWQGKVLNEELCQKVGFPMDEVGENQYILTPAELIGNLDDLQVLEIHKNEGKDEEVAKKQGILSKEDEMIELTSVIPLPLTEKQRYLDAYVREICNGDRENPLKKW